MRYRYIIIVLLALMGFTTKAKNETVSEIKMADPFILNDTSSSEYYLYGTHFANGIGVYSSKDLVHWAYRGLALDKANTTEIKNFWAPEVYLLGGKYYMYYAANEHMYAATADSPLGPFRQIGITSMIDEEKSIDPSILTTPDGLQYIFFVRFTAGNCIWQAQLEKDNVTIKTATLRKCIAVSQDWEKDLGHVNEGPCVLFHNQRYYMMYSGNDYRCQNYGIGVATTKQLGLAWRKYDDNPIMLRPEGLYGAGHNGFFYDKQGKLRIVFHAHESKDQVGSRRTYIGTLMFRNDSLLYDPSEPILRLKEVTTALGNISVHGNSGMDPALYQPSVCHVSACHMAFSSPAMKTVREEDCQIMAHVF